MKDEDLTKSTEMANVEVTDVKAVDDAVGVEAVESATVAESDKEGAIEGEGNDSAANPSVGDEVDIRSEQQGQQSRGRRRDNRRDERKRDQDELQIRVISVGRHSKMTKGGRRFSISALVVVGNPKEHTVGMGYGKAKDASIATEKAVRNAKRSMFKVSLREGRTLHHDIKTHFCASSIVMRSAHPGTGIIAGGPLRSLFDVLFGGHGDVVAKSMGSRNPMNVLKAAINALRSFDSPRGIANRRGKSVNDILVSRYSEGKSKAKDKGSQYSNAHVEEQIVVSVG